MSNSLNPERQKTSLSLSNPTQSLQNEVLPNHIHLTRPPPPNRPPDHRPNPSHLPTLHLRKPHRNLQWHQRCRNRHAALPRPYVAIQPNSTQPSPAKSTANLPRRSLRPPQHLPKLSRLRQTHARLHRPLHLRRALQRHQPASSTRPANLPYDKTALATDGADASGERDVCRRGWDACFGALR